VNSLDSRGLVQGHLRDRAARHAPLLRPGSESGCSGNGCVQEI